jgi:hypothetical protein
MSRYELPTELPTDRLAMLAMLRRAFWEGCDVGRRGDLEHDHVIVTAAIAEGEMVYHRAMCSMTRGCLTVVMSDGRRTCDCPCHVAFAQGAAAASAAHPEAAEAIR